MREHQRGWLDREKASVNIFTEGKSSSLEQISCATLVPVAHKLVGIIRKRGEWFKHLTC